MKLEKKHKIAVLMGGISDEREVSFKSGKAVTEALQKCGHNVVPVDITERSVDQLDAIQPDVVFNALHGEFGEDGEIQQLLDEKNVAYVGSGTRASRMGMDKTASKQAFIKHAVPTPDYLIIENPEDTQKIAQGAEELGYPLICKPVNGGSSIGVRIINSRNELEKAIRESINDRLKKSPQEAESDQKCPLVLERYILGREFTVGIVDGKALPIVEIRSERAFFDYHAKYADDKTEYIVPVPTLGKVYQEIAEVGIRAYEALGCKHVGRTDIIYGHDGHVYVLEVNTIPGFTPRSLVPMAAKQAGMEFPELCDRLCAMALRDAHSVEPDSLIYRRITA